MRTNVDKSTGRTITYPDEIAFSFNPLIIRYKNPAASSTPSVIITDIAISIDNDVISVRDERTIYNKEFMIDISSYVQIPPKYIDVDYSLKTSPSKAMKKVDVKVGGVILDPIYVIWGALSIGDRFNAGKRIKFFKNYPFSLSIYAPPPNSIRIDIDGKDSDMFKFFDGDMINVIPAMAEVWDDDIQHYVRADYQIYGEAQYFDKINTGAQFIHFDVDDSTDGVYLRWLNLHGGVNYWLFSAGDISVSNKKINGELCKNITINGVYYNINTPIGKQTVKTQRLCANLITSDGYDYVTEVSSSPIVEMYHNGVFIPVTVLDQTIINTNKSLQNIEITISYQLTTNQHL